MAERWPAGRCATARLLLLAFAWLLMAIDVRADPGSATAGVPVIEEKLASIVTHLREAGMAEALAAHVTTSGHWRIANTKGEVMTAASADELKRVIGILAPGAAARTSAPNIFLTTGATAQTAREALAWPAGARLSLLAGKVPLALRFESLDRQERLVAEVRPSLLLQISGVAEIEEALWQMDRPVTADAVRLLSLDPGGSRTIRGKAARDPASKAPLADAVDPYGLAKALPALKGQKVLVVGRLDKELLWYQPRTGAEQSILAGDLRSVAADNDIALVILDTRLPRQPGERTWAYIKVEVPGLGEAMKAATMADFYAALGVAHGRLGLRVVELTSQRVRMEAVPIKTTWGRRAGERGVGGVLQDVVTGLTGNLAPLGVRMELPSRARQEELSRRWISGVPSAVQLTYGLLLALGLAAWPIVLRWWGWLWPAESRHDYRVRAGYVAALGVRWLILVAVFVPAVAVVAFPVAVFARLWETARLVALSVGLGQRPASRIAGKNAGADP